MMKTHRIGALALLTLSLSQAAHAATLKADYQFANTFASTGVVAPALTPIDQGGSTGTFATETVNGIPNVPVFTFTSNRGLIANTSGVVTNNDYSAVFYARFEVLAASGLPPTSPIVKLLDFKNRTSDSGQYLVAGVPTFYDGLLPAVPGVGLLANDVYAQIALTRSAATNLVSVYLDGAPLFSFTDTGGLTTLDSNVLTLFADDPNTAGVPLGLQIEAADGAIARLRLYDGALTPTEVAALDTIPEPTTLSVLAALPLLMRRRRA